MNQQRRVEECRSDGWDDRRGIEHALTIQTTYYYSFEKGSVWFPILVRKMYTKHKKIFKILRIFNLICTEVGRFRAGGISFLIFFF